MPTFKDLMVGGADGRSALLDFALLLLRAAAGASLALGHGLGKLPVSDQFVDGVAQMGLPAPAVFAWAAALSEAVGGALLAIGLLTRPAAFFILCTMATAFFVVHGADPFQNKELAMLYGVVALTFLLAGAGRYSVDALLRRR
jgi:putative oxidoreductase